MPDELELLRGLGPAPDEPSAATLAAAEARLRQSLRSDLRWGRRPLRLPRWARLAVVPVALALAVAGTFAATRSAAPSAGIQCFARASTSSDATVIDAARSPTRACAAMWSAGRVAGGASGAPSLVACDSGTGAVDVFPSADPHLCARLGLATLSPAYGASAARFAELEDELVARFASVRCPEPGRARAWVRTALRRHGLSAWTIRIGAGGDGSGFSSQRPCASLAFDSEAQTVTLVPITPRP